MVLPTVSSAEGDSFFVAAFTDDAGAQVLANRIRSQFDGLLKLKQAGLNASVAYSMLDARPPASGASTETMVAAMVASLQLGLVSEASHYEQ